MKVKFIGKNSLRFHRQDFKPGETYNVPEDLELPELYFEFLDKKQDIVDKTESKSKSKKSSKKDD